LREAGVVEDRHRDTKAIRWTMLTAHLKAP